MEYSVKGDLYYTKEHVWVKIENGTGIIGITDFAQKQLHEITFVELPEKNRSVKRNDEIATVNSPKASAPIYSPLTGEIIDVNVELEENPFLINEDPYGKGWLIKIKPTNLGEEKGLLLSADQYRELLEKEVAE